MLVYLVRVCCFLFLCSQKPSALYSGTLCQEKKKPHRIIRFLWILMYVCAILSVTMIHIPFVRISEPFDRFISLSPYRKSIESAMCFQMISQLKSHKNNEMKFLWSCIMRSESYWLFFQMWNSSKYYGQHFLKITPLACNGLLN